MGPSVHWEGPAIPMHIIPSICWEDVKASEAQ